MPNKQSAKKRMRQSEKKRMQNKSMKSALRTQVKKLLASMGENKEIEQTKTEFSKTMGMLDRAGQKRLIHPCNADRKKSRLHSKFNDYLAKRPK